MHSASDNRGGRPNPLIEHDWEPPTRPTNATLISHARWRAYADYVPDEERNRIMAALDVYLDADAEARKSALAAVLVICGKD